MYVIQILDSVKNSKSYLPFQSLCINCRKQNHTSILYYLDQYSLLLNHRNVLIETQEICPRKIYSEESSTKKMMQRLIIVDTIAQMKMPLLPIT